jgi:hypothetical protein
VLLKILWTRERDLDDAASVIRALAGRFDRSLLEREATELAREVPDHDVARRLEALENRVRDPTT